MAIKHPTGTPPKSVALIAAGPSKNVWVDYVSGMELADGLPEEVWTINCMGRGLRSDLTFIMDDYTYFRGHFPSFATWYEKCPHPIITSVPRPECPNAVIYPLAHILSMPGVRPYLNHTVAYCIAYAIAIGVKNLMIFGADYISPNAPYATGFEQQQGAARYLGCASFWLGYASAKGMQIYISPKSPLLDADVTQDQLFYGYVVKPVVRRALAHQAPPLPAGVDGTSPAAAPPPDVAEDFNPWMLEKGPA
jgi:hypothetical protein